jgi:hypothetical protein
MWRAGFLSVVAGTVWYEGSCFTGFCKVVLLHLVGVPYYFTYNDDARSHTNQVYVIILCTLPQNTIRIRRINAWGCSTQGRE